MQTTEIRCYPHPTQVTFDIPDSLAQQLIAAGKDPARKTLELLAVEGYRTRKLSENEVRIMLNFRTPMQVHALLKEHDVYLNYSLSDVEQDTRASDELQAMRLAESSRQQNITLRKPHSGAESA